MARKEENWIEFPKRISKNAQERYMKNLEYERAVKPTLDQFGHINGQGRYPIGDMQFGSVKASGTACEVIAIYNVLKDLGKEVRLADLIFYNEIFGYMFAFGAFGTKINKIGHFLDKFDVDFEKVEVKSFIEKARKNKYKDGQIFIVTIKNNAGHVVSALHTFEMVYYNKKWVVFNRFNNVKKPSVYDSIGAVLQNGKTIGSFFYIYKINGLRETDVKTQ